MKKKARKNLKELDKVSVLTATALRKSNGASKTRVKPIGKLSKSAGNEELYRTPTA